VFIYIFGFQYFFEFQNPFKTMLQATARITTFVFIFTIVSKLLLAQSDDCSTPTTLTPGTSCSNTSGTLFNATSSGIAGSCAGTIYDVWYTFTTPAGCTSVDIDMAAISAGGNSLTAHGSLRWSQLWYYIEKFMYGNGHNANLVR
jgi:hypothetical protein